MLTLELVHEIERLLAQGDLSHRAIAARLNVGRSSVSAIAMGRRGPWGKSGELADLPERLSPRRCQTCGALVAIPCVACLTRGYQDRRRLLEECAAIHAPARAMGGVRLRDPWSMRDTLS